MKKKRFAGWIDGHYMQGTIVEMNDDDCQQEAEAVSSVIKTTGKIVGAVALGALLLGAIAASAEDKD